MENPLVAVQKFGQSIWYDNIWRSLITSGELQGRVDHDGLLGVTSNPAIFEKALAGSTDYNQALKALVAQGVGTAQDIYERMATTLGYGPRFLHPTGQLHKGGPNTGVFLQITAEDTEDVPIPGQRFGPDVWAGLARLREIVQSVV